MSNPPRPDHAAHQAACTELKAGIESADAARARAQKSFLHCRESNQESKVRAAIKHARVQSVHTQLHALRRGAQALPRPH